MKEAETRKRFLKYAKDKGIEFEMKLLLDKFDRLLNNCTNEKERADIAKLGCVEVYRLINNGNLGGDFFINGEQVIKSNTKG